MYSVIFSLCNDVDEESRLLFQREAMCLAVGLRATNDPPFKDPIDDPVGVCWWQGVSCDIDKRIRSIHWVSHNAPLINFPYIHVRWIPNTVRLMVIIYKQPKEDVFESRFLPREARRIRLTSGNFRGTLEVAALPRGLIELDLDSNKLHGDVDLRDLPPAIKVLNLRWNNFQMVIVDNGRLPESLTLVDFMTDQRMHTREVNGKLLDCRIALNRST